MSEYRYDYERGLQHGEENLMERLAREITEAKAEAYQAGLEDGQSDRMSLHMYKADCEKLAGIVADMIAELSRYKDYALLEEYRPIKQALWKAEQRLKEVQGNSGGTDE